MEKTIGYILSQLRDHDLAVKTIKRVLRKQIRFNNTVAFSSFCATLYILMNEKRLAEQRRINSELRKEIETLKQTKGE